MYLAQSPLSLSPPTSGAESDDRESETQVNGVGMALLHQSKQMTCLLRNTIPYNSSAAESWYYSDGRGGGSAQRENATYLQIESLAGWDSVTQ